LSSFLGIEIAKKALFANQMAQQTVSHNIANANTPGYSRQRAMLESTYTAYGFGANYQMGTGVKYRISIELEMNLLTDNTEMKTLHWASGIFKAVS